MQELQTMRPRTHLLDRIPAFCIWIIVLGPVGLCIALGLWGALRNATASEVFWFAVFIPLGLLFIAPMVYASLGMITAMLRFTIGGNRHLATPKEKIYSWAILAVLVLLPLRLILSYFFRT